MNLHERYQSRFANTHRNSLLLFSTQAKGEIAWKQVHDHGMYGGDVIIYSWGELVLVVTVTQIHTLNQDGILLWSISKRYSSPVVIAEELPWYQHPTGLLSSFDREGRIIHDTDSFPGVGGEADHTELLFPRKEDFIASVYNLNQRDHDEMTGINLSSNPEITILRNVYGGRFSAFVKAYIRVSELPPLFSPESSMVSLLSFDGVTRVDVSGKKEYSTFPVPCHELVEWSILENGHYCFVGYDDNHKMIVTEVTHDGEISGRYDGIAMGDMWISHPPVTGPKSQVYVLTDHRVLAIDAGELLWEYVYPEPHETGYACSLSDGSLLIAHGARLSHLNEQGNVLFTLILDSNIIGQPTVSENGSIFVATHTEIVCIQ